MIRLASVHYVQVEDCNACLQVHDNLVLIPYYSGNNRSIVYG